MNKVEVIHNAINPDRVAHDGLHDAIDRAVDDHIDAPSHPGNRVVVMLANFVHAAKDHETMLQAVQLVVRQHPDVHFVLAGDGPLLPDVQARSQKLHLERHVTFSVRCRDVGALLARAAVCVLSSRLEGFPNAILEYMAAGRPVVATDVGGVREAVLDGTTGLIVAPGDAAALATALIRVLDDKVWGQNMGRAGRARVHSHFSVPHQMERITSLYARELARAEMRS